MLPTRLSHRHNILDVNITDRSNRAFLSQYALFFLPFMLVLNQHYVDMQPIRRQLTVQVNFYRLMLWLFVRYFTNRINCVLLWLNKIFIIYRFDGLDKPTNLSGREWINPELNHATPSTECLQQWGMHHFVMKCHMALHGVYIYIYVCIYINRCI